MKKLLLFFMSFFTLLGFAQFPEGFENAAIALNTSPPATGWATFNNGIGTNNWIRSNTQTPRGTALARISQQQNVTNSIKLNILNVLKDRLIRDSTQIAYLCLTGLRCKAR